MKSMYVITTVKCAALENISAKSQTPYMCNLSLKLFSWVSGFIDINTVKCYIMHLS